MLSLILIYVYESIQTVLLLFFGFLPLLSVNIVHRRRSPHAFFLDLHLVSLPVSILSNFISLNTFFYCAYTHTHTLFIMVCTSQCLSMFLMDVEEIGHKPVIYLWHMNILPLCYKKIHSPLFNYIILFTFHILSSYYVRSSCAIASLLNIY